MRAISLWQPWATAVARGSKRIETRHWATAYRGPLAIHAAKRRVRSELRGVYHADPAWRAAMGWDENRFADAEAMPFGAIVGVAYLADCRPSESFTAADLDALRDGVALGDPPGTWTERDMGNFAPGRFGWVLTDATELLRPISVTGRQGFFTIDDALLPVTLRPVADGRLL